MKSAVHFLLLTVLLSSGGCGAPHEERRSLETGSSMEKIPFQESWNMSFFLTEAAIRKGTLNAGHAAEYRNNGKSTIYLDQGVHVILYNDAGKPPTILDAREAVIHDNRDIEASGNVVVSSGKGNIIRTAYLKRTDRDRMIRSNRHVTITGQDGTVQGYGFESDQALKRYKIFRGSGEALVR
ncbi:LPS export ABC transporter periplasmic protein LptC [Chlorobium limicola]|nr:LPS export ABC transporter periplasmic protein LptC [Chlorobium limicola]